ncbi:MAG: asparagine synthase C-terminal domain-containing protein, partial [Gemmatimonadales bacterium]
RLHHDHAVALLPELLQFGDAYSMAHSVESRLPFLDHRLVEFVFGLPFDQKLRGAETKVLLRRAIGPELPKEIIERRDKVGFGTPVREWLREHRDAIHDTLTSQRIRERGVFDPAVLSYCLAQFEATGAEARKIFLAVGLELWYQRCVDGGGGTQ